SSPSGRSPLSPATRRRAVADGDSVSFVRAPVEGSVGAALSSSATCARSSIPIAFINPASRQYSYVLVHPTPCDQEMSSSTHKRTPAEPLLCGSPCPPCHPQDRPMARPASPKAFIGTSASDSASA